MNRDSNDAESGEVLLYEWKVCSYPVAVDYIPFLDNRKAIKLLKSRWHMEHRGRWKAIVVVEQSSKAWLPGGVFIWSATPVYRDDEMDKKKSGNVYCCFKSLTDLPVWVMNIVSVNGSDTLPVIFDTGLIGIYHDWCESLSTYPRTYDLQYSSFLFGNLTSRCDMLDIAVEMDRILDQLEDSGRYHRNVKEVETYFAVASLVNRLTSGEISCGKDRFLASRNYTINKIF
ncbi:hypothetical protein E3N88_03369 [Mikania micrantha]|uniref:Methyltransferase n=1 Tax=Mikania micrantha TaxID=192012 RepID=A0A5N6Q6S8_9ASTR|nr:hypothetical protein E3N88_03369 [Mikania micrantha]